MHEKSFPGSVGVVGRWLVVALLGVIAACLLIEVGFATSAARGQVTGGGAGKVFAVAGQVTPGTYGLYLLDLETNTICVYQYVSTERQLRLVAARTTVFDRQLDEYNTKPPPRDIRQLVEQHKRLDETKTKPEP